jgi:DNA (cytosine-5)-methyltransferase 1
MRTLVDLFAGCGGLSLGLEQSGFVPVFVSELHPDALETYLSNRQHIGLDRSSRVINDIFEITGSASTLRDLAAHLRSSHGDIDLVAGGPPCQGFSGIGHRRSFPVMRREIPSNHLYREMAKVIGAIGPKAFVFENVSGIRTSRWSPDGTPGEIWEDVVDTFNQMSTRVAGKGQKYVIKSDLIRTSDYGVPQNRPRVLLIGLREDISFSETDGPASGLLPRGDGQPPDLIDLLGDLMDEAWVSGGTTSNYPHDPSSDIQLSLRRVDAHVAAKGTPVSDHSYSKHSARVTERFAFMLENGGLIPPELKTKKFSQRLLPPRWDERGPNITATSLPDDYVHFAQPRILTVREWARLQTFPDWYRFCGKRTTGGRRRAGNPEQGDWTRELPKYTQIGNAVPVRLAAAIGEHLNAILP